MTKEELKKLIPSVRFSGKSKTVYISAEDVNHENTIALNSYCARTGSTWELSERH